MKTLDRTPVITERLRHRKQKRNCPKPFKIEGRYIGEPNVFAEAIIGRQWRVVGAYETKRARQDAMKTHANKTDWWHRNHEYRPAGATP